MAEGICILDPNYTGEESQLKVKYIEPSVLFGKSDKANIAYSKLYVISTPNRNIHANPEAGDAYVIVRQKIEEDETPFHVAYVILTDGNSTLTIETDASKPKDKKPLFDMYLINDNFLSFHKRFENTYTTTHGVKPITMVLTKKY